MYGNTVIKRVINVVRGVGLPGNLKIACILPGPQYTILPSILSANLFDWVDHNKILSRLTLI